MNSLSFSFTINAPSKRQDTRDAIAYAVGVALNEWGKVESAVSSLFHCLSRIPDHRTAEVIMASIISFEARVKTCANLARAADLIELHRQYWKWLGNRLLREAALRNELAHFSIVRKIDKDLRETVELRPYFSWGRIYLDLPLGQEKVLSPQQIYERAEGFRKLGRETKWLAHELAYLRGKFEENPLPMPDRAREIQTSIDRKTEGKPPRPQSSQESAREAKLARKAAQRRDPKNRKKE